MQNCLKKGLINIHVLFGYHLIKGHGRERGNDKEREKEGGGNCIKQSFSAKFGNGLQS